jgi:hypothetical protein
MLARHELTVVGRCPVDGCPDVYEVTVRTRRVVRVEDIKAAAAGLTAEPRMQEELTLRLAEALGAGVEVETVGYHSGVKTTAVEGSLS